MPMFVFVYVLFANILSLILSQQHHHVSVCLTVVEEHDDDNVDAYVGDEAKRGCHCWSLSKLPPG